MFCTNCGAELKDTAKFCTRCGKPVGRRLQSDSIGQPKIKPVSESCPAGSPSKEMQTNEAKSAVQPLTEPQQNVLESKTSLQVEQQTKVMNHTAPQTIAPQSKEAPLAEPHTGSTEPMAQRPAERQTNGTDPKTQQTAVPLPQKTEPTVPLIPKQPKKGSRGIVALIAILIVLLIGAVMAGILMWKGVIRVPSSAGAEVQKDAEAEMDVENTGKREEMTENDKRTEEKSAQDKMEEETDGEEAEKETRAEETGEGETVITETEVGEARESETAGDKTQDMAASDDIVMQQPETMEAPIPISEVVYSSQVDYSKLHYIPVTRDMVRESSYLVQKTGSYDNSGYSAFDGDTVTSWQENVVGDGIGQYVAVDFGTVHNVKVLTFNLGNHRSSNLYYKNNVPKELLISLDGAEFTADFPQEMEEFAFVLSSAVPTQNITVTVNQVYKGTAYDDTIIAEIGIYGE